MKHQDLTSSNIGVRVIYKDDLYNKYSKKWESLTVDGIIESLLIDINFGAYGYRVKSEHKTHNFILHNIHTKNLIGRNLEDLTLFQ